jgi:hypothetical protein
VKRGRSRATQAPRDFAGPEAMASAVRCLLAVLDDSPAASAVQAVPSEHLSAIADFAITVLVSGAWVQAQLTPEQWDRARSDPPDVWSHVPAVRSFLTAQLERYTLEAMFAADGEVTAGVR